MNWKWPTQLELTRPVGEGWLGVIYQARDPDSPRQVYTRVLSEDARRVPEGVRSSLLFHATAQHPHVLPTTLPEVSGGESFYSMQPAERGSLRVLAEQYRAAGQRLDPLSALDLVRQAGEALAFAHARGTHHGNLKPENVLLQPGRALLGREGFHVLLSDFGLNALRPPAPSPYLSPRQRRGEPAEAEGDLYGLGALLFFALSGEDPPPAPTLETLSALPLEGRALAGRALGLLTPFSSAAELTQDLMRRLPHLSPAPLSAPTPPAVTLRAEEERLRLVPGEPYLTRVRLQTQAALSGVLIAEGLPPSWVSLPPAVQVHAGQTLTLPLTFRVPREAQALSAEREVRLLFVRAHPELPGELIAEHTLLAEILPFHAGELKLRAPAQPVHRVARLELELTNRGNGTRHYELRAHLPPGEGQVEAPLAPLTLAPGERAQVPLGVRLGWGGLRGRRVTVEVTAQELGAAEGARSPALRATAAVRRRPAAPLWASAALLGALALGSWQAARVPSIGAFSAQTPLGGPPVRGEAFTLSWTTAGARSVRVLELPGRALAPSGTLELPAPGADTTYTLEARGWLRPVRRQLILRPRPPAPSITALSVTPASADYGEAVTVRWAVRNAPPGQPLRLSPWGEVPAQGERTLALRRDTAFTLTVPGGAAGPGRQARAAATLRPPAIRRLTVTPARVKPGGAVTVQWQVSGARQVRLSGLGTLPAEGRRTLNVPPDARARLRYVLKASNGQTEVSADAEVGVTLPEPVITAFRAVPAAPVVGQPVKVFWRTTGADSVELRWAGGRQRVPVRGTLTLSAAPGLRELGLLAEVEGGARAERRVTLDPQPQAAAPVAAVSAPTPDEAAPAPRLQAGSPPASRSQPGSGTAEGKLRASPRVSAGSSSAPAPAAPSSPPRRPPSVASAPERAPSVRVLGFRSEPAAPRVGDAVTVRWSVQGVREVTLLGAQGRQLGRYPARGFAVLRPQEAGVLRLQLGVAGEARVLGRLSVAVAERPRPVTAVAPARPVPARAPAVVIRGFRAAPGQVKVGQATTLVWQVTGARQVSITGLRGPNPDGSFPAASSAPTPRLSRDTTYVLEAGGERRSLRVAVSPARAPVSAPASDPAPAALPDSPYQALRGTWSHSLGLLTVEVTRNRLSGTLYSSEAGLPGGTLEGTLQGPPDSATFSGYLTSGGERVAVALRFSGGTAFEGVYAGERRQTWCGWRGTVRSGC